MFAEDSGLAAPSGGYVTLTDTTFGLDITINPAPGEETGDFAVYIQATEAADSLASTWLCFMVTSTAASFCDHYCARNGAPAPSPLFTSGETDFTY